MADSIEWIKPECCEKCRYRSHVIGIDKTSGNGEKLYYCDLFDGTRVGSYYCGIKWRKDDGR